MSSRTMPIPNWLCHYLRFRLPCMPKGGGWGGGGDSAVHETTLIRGIIVALDSSEP